MMLPALPALRGSAPREYGSLVSELTQLALRVSSRAEFQARSLGVLARTVPFARGSWPEGPVASPGGPAGARLDGSLGVLELPLERCGRVVGRLRLERDGAGFAPIEVQLLRAVVPTIVLAREGVHDEAPPAGTRTLTARELEIVEYVRLGYTNAQIALATGRSLAAVRNVLVRIFDKTGVRTRSQLVVGEVSTAGLTTRERQIVEHLRAGRTNREIGAELGISVNTVRNTLARLFEKTGVSSRSELMGALAQAASAG